MGVDYHSVTEIPGSLASKEQLERLFMRYHFALPFVKGKSVLEVGCGAGMGLGYLAKEAEWVVGGDVDRKNLLIAAKTYKKESKVSLLQLNGETLPFKRETFDIILLFEAIYYFPQPEKFVEEAYRVLKKNGVLIIETVNKEWSGFTPSPFSIRYFSAEELHQLLSPYFKKISLYGAFAENEKTFARRVLLLIRRLAGKLGLIPRTLKGREKLKRVIYGPLTPIPLIINEKMAIYHPPEEISARNGRYYKLLLAIGYK